MRIALFTLLVAMVVAATAVVLLLWVWQPGQSVSATASAPPETAAVTTLSPPASIESRFEAVEAPPTEVDGLRAELEAAFAQQQRGDSEFTQEPTVAAERSIEAAPQAPAPLIAMPAATSLAEFPWPPPVPSSQAAIPASTFRTDARRSPSLAEVGARLTGALDQAGYAYGFYRAPNGFALASQLEQIGEDGARVSTDAGPPPVDGRPFQFSAIMDALGNASAGYYRIIIFVVSDGALVPSTRPMPEAEGQALAGDGAAALADDFNDRPFSDAHFVTALIYEFRKGEEARDVATLYPGRFNGADHLVSAGLLRAIERGG